MRQAKKDQIPVVFDRFFNPSFFKLGNETNNPALTEYDFKVPASEALFEFFRSEDGRLFKEKAAKIVDKLTEWCSDKEIDTKPLASFKSNFIVDYIGLDAEINKQRLPVYQYGFKHLASMHHLLASGKISVEFGVQVLKNLLPALNVCVPGIYVNIAQAHEKLFAYLNIDVRCREARYEIAKETVLELLRPFNVQAGTEIHHVVAVLNRFTEAVGIQILEDEYANHPGICKPKVIAALTKQFSVAITKSLTPTNIIEHIINQDLNLDKLQYKLQSALAEGKNYSHITEDYESKIKLYDDNILKSFFYLDSIICDDYQSLAYCAREVVFLAVVDGFINKNHFAIEQYQRYSLSKPGAYIAYLGSEQSLQFAYVYQPNALLGRCFQPLISYCIETCIAQELSNEHPLISFITNLSESQKIKLAKKMWAYLDSYEYKNSDNQDMQFQRLLPILIILLKADLIYLFPKDKYVAVLADLVQDTSNNPLVFWLSAVKHNCKDALVKLLEKNLIHKPNPYPNMYSLLSDLLYIAATLGHTAIVDLLLTKSCNVNYQDKNKFSCLMKAAQNGHTETVIRLIEAGAKLNALSTSGHSAIYYAATNGHAVIVIVLINALENAHQNINESDDPDQLTPLITAAKHNHVPVIQELLSCNQIKVDQADQNGLTALIWAAKEGATDAVKQLITVGADIHHQAKNGSTALSYAAQNGQIAVIETLVAQGADINHVSAQQNGETALIWAIQGGQIEAVKCLLNLGANVNLRLKCGLFPIEYAIKQNKVDIVKLLLNDRNIAIDKVRIIKRNLITWAIQNKHNDILKSLIAHASLELLNNNHVLGYTPLNAAAFIGNLEAVQLLLQSGMVKVDPDLIFWTIKNNRLDILSLIIQNSSDRQALMDSRDGSGCTPLIGAAKHGHLDIVMHLLKFGADPNQRAGNSSHALSFAAQMGHLAIVKELVNAGASIDQASYLQNGETALFYALREGKLEVVKYLLTQQADINKPLTNGVCPLLYAIKLNKLDIVKVLLESTAIEFENLQIEDHNLFYWATKNEHINILQLLIEKRITKSPHQINSVEEYGNTLLHYACACRGDLVTQLSMVQKLIDKGADVNRTNAAGCSALMYALARDYHLTELLLKKGAHFKVNPYIDYSACLTGLKYAPIIKRKLAQYPNQKTIPLSPCEIRQMIIKTPPENDAILKLLIPGEIEELKVKLGKILGKLLEYEKTNDKNNYFAELTKEIRSVLKCTTDQPIDFSLYKKFQSVVDKIRESINSKKILMAGLNTILLEIVDDREKKINLPSTTLTRQSSTAEQNNHSHMSANDNAGLSLTSEDEKLRLFWEKYLQTDCQFALIRQFTLFDKENKQRLTWKEIKEHASQKTCLGLFKRRSQKVIENLVKHKLICE